MSDASSSASDPARQSRITTGLAAVGRQCERLHADLGRVASERKADGSRVTVTDHAISQAILADLAEAHPEDQGLSEELLVDGPVSVKSEYAWVLDPIDGTNNFIAGLPQCAISLALFQHGEPVYGILYDAVRRVMLHGGPGHGAWEGERPLQVSRGGLTRSSLIGFHSIRAAGEHPGHGEALINSCKIRGLGSSALHLAYVAAGLLDGVVDHNVKLWDIAAGIPLLRAAGGEVRFLANNPLPLRQFDLEMPRILYVGGPAAMCVDLAAMLASADRLHADI